jgi:hypothetical protein
VQRCPHHLGQGVGIPGTRDQIDGHRYGDRRMPVPGVLGMLAAAISAALVAVSGRWLQTGAAGVAVGLLVVWLVN